MANHENILTNGDDLDEVITPHGIYKIIDSSTASLIFTNPQGSGVMLSVNPDKDGLSTGGAGAEDLLLLRPTNLIYFDDGISNQPAFITDVNFNPCPVNQVIKINSTVELDVTVTDTNNPLFGIDLVNSEVILYDGTSNSQTSTSSNRTSGSTFTHQTNNNGDTLTFNQTIVNGIITVKGRDSTEPPIATDTQTFSFTVADNGLEFNDLECDFEFLDGIPVTGPEAEEDFVDTINTVDSENNAVVGAVATLVELTSVGGTAIWIIIIPCLRML